MVSMPIHFSVSFLNRRPLLITEASSINHTLFAEYYEEIRTGRGACFMAVCRGKVVFWSFTLYNYFFLKIQGGNQLLTKSMDQLLPLFESWWLFDHTGGSPDVVHLIINASKASDLLLKAQTGLEKNSPVFKHWSKFINFWDIVIIDFHSFLFKIKKNNVFKQEIGFTWY